MKLSRQYSSIAAVALALSFLGAPAAADDPEDELKSAIVLSFLRYSTWKVPLPAAGTLTVGVLGRASIRQVLVRQLEAKSVENRVLHIVELKSAGDPCHCQAIYIATEKRADIKLALQTAHAAHALTIGETDKFLEYGGAVNLIIVDGHMSFEVNLEALEEGGVDISSRLLRLGQVRRRRPA